MNNINFLLPDAVFLSGEAKTPEEAIREAGDLLERANISLPSYTDAMVEAFHSLGSYIVLAPHIAMPHARPDDRVLKAGFGLLRLNQPIKFGHPENDPVKILIPLAGVNNHGHIEMLQILASVLSEPMNIDILLSSSDVNEIISLFDLGNITEE